MTRSIFKISSKIAIFRSIILVLIITFTNFVYADYRDTPQGKLDAARKYADAILQEDAKPGQQFFTRTPKFPVWKDQPIIDCDIYAVMRAVQTKEPYFEDKKKNVVIVPVWVELLTIQVGETSGYPFSRDEEGKVQCRFEYEPYSFKTNQFETAPNMLKKPYIETFKGWGEMAQNEDLLRRPLIAINESSRYVRFKFRVSVARDAPYQLYPQFPRHHPVESSIQKLEWVDKYTADLFEKGISTRGADTNGKQLITDLKYMENSLINYKWHINKLKAATEKYKTLPSFSEIKP